MSLGGRRGGGGGSVSVPVTTPNRQFVYADMNDTSRMMLINGAKFDGTSATGYLSAANISAYNWAANNQWSVSFWRNPQWAAISGGTGLSQAYVCKTALNDGSTANHGFWLASPGTTAKADEVDVMLYIGSAKTYASIRCKPLNFQTEVNSGAQWPGGWSHFCLTYNAGTINVYFDGVLSCTASGTTVSYGAIDGTIATSIPATMANCAAPIDVGVVNNGTLASRSNADANNGIISHVCFWGGKAITQADVTVLSNNGFPVTYSSISSQLSTAASGAWDLGDSSGNRTDLSTNANAMVPPGSSTVTRAQSCVALVEKGPLQLIFRPIAYARSPVLSTVMNGQTALHFGGNHGLECRLDGAMKQFQSHDMVCAFRPSIVGATDSVDRHFGGISSQAEKANDTAGSGTQREYYFGALYGNPGASGSRASYDGVAGHQQMYHRYKNQAATGFIRGQGNIAANTNYVVALRCYGTGNAASWGNRINGVVDPLDVTYQITPGNTYGTNTTGSWNQNAAGMFHNRMVLSIGYLNYFTATQFSVGDVSGAGIRCGMPGDCAQDFFQGDMMFFGVWGKATTGPTLSDPEIAAAEAPWRTLCGV
jgi:hypothetical protein